ncbi:MAG: rubredoxin [bacterium]
MAKISYVIGRWICTVCDYLYDASRGDPTNGVKPKTPFVSLPEHWVCPGCGAMKDDFVLYVDERDESHRYI